MRKVKFASTCLLLWLLMLVTTSLVFAYAYTGFKWGKTDIFVWIDSSQLRYGQVYDAVLSWNPGTDITLHNVTYGGEDVAFTGDYYGYTGWDGLTYYWEVNGNILHYVGCYLNRTYTDSYVDMKYRSVAAHELGHAVGLDDVAQFDQALMNPYTCGPGSRWCSYNIISPTTDEKNGVNNLY